MTKQKRLNFIKETVTELLRPTDEHPETIRIYLKDPDEVRLVQRLLKRHKRELIYMQYFMWEVI